MSLSTEQAINSTMTASEIKERFAERFVDKYVISNELRDLACSDIVVVDRDLNMREYEIKVSISDLRRELSKIDYISTHSPKDYINFGENKLDKHRVYLNGLSEDGQWTRDLNTFFCPATFSFLISRELYEKEKTRLDKLPYGVMDSSTFEILKPAKHLKEAKKATTLQLWKIAHSQSYKLLENKKNR